MRLIQGKAFLILSGSIITSTSAASGKKMSMVSMFSLINYVYIVKTIFLLIQSNLIIKKRAISNEVNKVIDI